jgi:hypothetical protein
MATVKIVTNAVYGKPAVNALGGARWEFRSIALITGDVASASQLTAISLLPAGHRVMDAFLEIGDLDSHAAPSLNISIGILNTYWAQALAGSSALPTSTYNSGGVTDTGTTAACVAGQYLMYSLTIARAGGRTRLGDSGANSFVLEPASAIGVDKNNDRIICLQIDAAAGTAKMGNLYLGICLDRDQE